MDRLTFTKLQAVLVRSFARAAPLTSAEASGHQPFGLRRFGVSSFSGMGRRTVSLAGGVPARVRTAKWSPAFIVTFRFTGTTADRASGRNRS